MVSVDSGSAISQLFKFCSFPNFILRVPVGAMSRNGVTVIKRIKADKSRANADEE
jgi:hypothetical protein